jgi:hypothetical protein
MANSRKPVRDIPQLDPLRLWTRPTLITPAHPDRHLKLAEQILLRIRGPADPARF